MFQSEMREVECHQGCLTFRRSREKKKTLNLFRSTSETPAGLETEQTRLCGQNCCWESVERNTTVAAGSNAKLQGS